MKQMAEIGPSYSSCSEGRHPKQSRMKRSLSCVPAVLIVLLSFLPSVSFADLCDDRLREAQYSITIIEREVEKETQGVKAVHERSYTGGVAELMLDYGGKSSMIANALANQSFTGFRLEPTNVTPNRIDVKAVLDK